MTDTTTAVAAAGAKCDRCSHLIHGGPNAGRWSACTCPGGPTRATAPGPGDLTRSNDPQNARTG